MSIETYGSYQLLKRLATGGMAEIYLARQVGLEGFEKLLVVKRILPHLGENEDFVRMFLDEARIAARLNHTNIVQIFNLGAQDASYFIAMEYIHGEDLRRLHHRTLTQEMPLPVPLACRIIVEACAGLDYAHKKTDGSGRPMGLVHRDISPQNILVTYEGGVKIVDFGIAKAADQATITRSGVIKGKYSYMSPEQAAGMKVDARSDVFALGVVLYEMLTGTRLFKRSGDVLTLQAVAECKVPLPSSVNPRVPRDLEPILLEALAKSPDQRYPDARSFQLALENWLITHRLPSSSAHLAAYMQALYADRLAEEARSGEVMVETEAPAPGLKSLSEMPVARRASQAQTRVGRVREGLETVDERQGQETVSVLAPSLAATVEERGHEPRRGRQRPVEGMSPRSGRTPVPRLEPEDHSFASDTVSTAVATAPNERRKRSVLLPLGVLLLAVLVGLSGAWLLLREAPRAQVLLATEPPGARVLFNGTALSGVTPLTLPPVPGGRYAVVLALEGHQELRTAVDIPETGTLALEPLRLASVASAVPDDTPAPEPSSVRMRLETYPPDALVMVDGEERGRSPVRVMAKPGQSLRVRVEAPRHRSLSQTIEVGAAPEQVKRLVLEPLPEPPPVVRKKEPRSTSTESATETRPPADTRSGTVRFAVTPWAEVICGGRPLGTTPFPDVQLPPGVYECKFKNPDKGTLSRRVEVSPGAHRTVIVKFN